jgi:hypothetical protein
VFTSAESVSFMGSSLPLVGPGTMAGWEIMVPPCNCVNACGGLDAPDSHNLAQIFDISWPDPASREHSTRFLAPIEHGLRGSLPLGMATSTPRKSFQTTLIGRMLRGDG